MVTYDYYRVFYHVALLGSFSKAAEALHGSQPNVARVINRLESQLNCKLFRRSNRGVTLTPEGRRLYAHVAIACEQLDRGEAELTGIRDLEAGAVSVGASETALRLFLLERIEEFHTRHPGIQLKIRNSQTPDTLEALESNQIELAVVTAPFRAGSALHAERVFSFEEILIASARRIEFASRRRSIAELTRVPLLSLPKNSSSFEFYTHYFLNHGHRYMPDIETETADQVPPLVMRDLGLSFFPKTAAQEYIREGSIVEVPLADPPGMRDTWLVYDPARALSAPARRMIECIRGGRDACRA